MKEPDFQLLGKRYADLMQEIKERTLSLGPILEDKTELHGALAREFCYLQLRMICECIALSCLVAHGHSLPLQTSKFQKETYADRLMRALSDLHVDFFPQAIITTPHPGFVHIAPKTVPHLTKDELVKLTHICGGKLHRGSLRTYKFEPSEQDLKKDFAFIEAFASKILRLLETHRIRLVGGTDHIMCALHYGPGGVVHVAYAGLAPLTTSAQASYTNPG